MSIESAWTRISAIHSLFAPPAANPQPASPPAPGFSEALSASRSSNSAPQAPAWIEGLISRASQKYGVEAGLIRAVMRAESSFDPRAGSSAGAQGLMQLMPETARGLGVTDITDPGQNVDAGVRYLKQQLDKFGRVDLALAAYNAGPGAVSKYNGIPPYPETQAYVKKIMAEIG